MAESVVSLPLSASPPPRRASSHQQRPSLAVPRHFYVGPENLLVVQAVEAILSRKQSRAVDYSPIVITARSGYGKTHLCQGIIYAWTDLFPKKRAESTTGADFARQLANAIDAQAEEDFQRQYRDADLLVFENLQQLIGREAAQIELIHTLDRLRDRGRPVLITTTRPVDRLPTLPAALATRLTAGLEITIGPHRQETREAILAELFELRKMRVPDHLLRQLATRLQVNPAKLVGAVAQIFALSHFQNRPVDERILADFFQQREEKEPSIHEIAKAVARHFKVRLSELRSSTRRRGVVTAREVAMHLARQVTGKTLKDIGQYFGGRHHTTVMHACQQVEISLQTDPTVREAIDELTVRWTTPIEDPPVKQKRRTKKK